MNRIKNPVILLIRKTILSLAVLLGTTIFLFLLIILAPGPRSDGSFQSREQKASVTYLRWLGSLLHGSLGETVEGIPVSDLLAPALKITTSLTVGALILATAISLLLARNSGKSSKMGDSWLEFILYSISATPIFLIGYGIYLYWIETYHQAPILPDPGGAALWTRLQFLSIPILILTIGDGHLIDLFRQFKTELQKIRRDDYVIGALALGISPRRRIIRNFLIPFIGIVGNRMTFLLGGAIVLETIFNLRGLGYLSWRAAQQRDFPLLLSLILVSVIIVRMINLAASIIQLILDPRLRKSQS